VRTALILAAGRGTRLGARGESLPKGFLELGGRPIVEASIERLEAAGLERVVIVTGHHAERYEALRARRPERVETVHNPRFASSGSLYSLWCAREAVAGEDVLLLESDLVYEPRALAVLAARPEPDVVLVSGPTGSGDEVWVEAEGGRLVAMSKDRARLGPGVLGELVGISRVSAALFGLLAAHMEAERARTLHLEYEADGLVAAARRRPIRCELVADLAWCEIDSEAHLARARELVHPRVRRLEAGAPAALRTPRRP
jgi:choline kinase